MDNKGLYSKYIELEEVHEKLEKYRKDFIKTVRGNPEFYDVAMEFSKRIEQVLSWYQTELNCLAFALIRQIKMEKKLIGVLEQYGIDPAQALSRDATNTVANSYKIPEKIVDYIDWDKVEKRHMEKKAEELVKVFPYLKSEIYKIYLK